MYLLWKEDGGATLYCNSCGARITCFDPLELVTDEGKLEYYYNFLCSDCSPMFNKEAVVDEDLKIYDSLSEEQKKDIWIDLLTYIIVHHRYDMTLLKEIEYRYKEKEN